MAKKKVGELIREARTAAGLTQEQLAQKIEGLSASELGRAERGEKDLTQAVLKQIAKATGVTQKSLLEAASGSTAKKTTASKSSTAAKTTASKKTSAGSKATGTSVKVTAAEKKLLELYRAAPSEAKKAAVALLKGEKLQEDSLVDALIDGAVDLISNIGKR